MKPSSILIMVALWLGVGCSPEGDEPLRYLAQQRPTVTPEIFAPDLISKKGEYEFGAVFNGDGTEFYYGVNVDGKEQIRYTQLVDGAWSEPTVLLDHPDYGYNDPFLSPEENRLYFISRMALDGKGEQKDYDIWYVEKQSNGWSEPINAGNEINTDGNEYYISFTNEGTMFFASNRKNYDFDIYQSQSVDGVFQTPVSLGDSVNTGFYEADVFVDPNEQYLIFCAERPDGYGRGDLYISFKNEDSTWSKSRNMGPKINSTGHELCPFVSKDGKYFFYTSNEDIYWVDAAILQEIKEHPAPVPNMNESHSAISGSAAQDSLAVLRRRIVNGEVPYIDGIVVSQGGELLIEEYFNGFGRDSLHQIRSAHKSITSLLAGIAVDQGLFAVEDKIGKYITEWKDDLRGDIRVKDLLEMRSGLACESFFDEGPNCEMEMWETEDWLGYMLEIPARHKPGTKWEYSSIEPDLVGVIIARTSKMNIMYFAKQHLFDPLGIESFDWSVTPDGRGYSAGSSYMKPTDMLKIAQLVKNQGAWEGKQIMSQEWIKASTHCHIPVGMSFLEYSGLGGTKTTSAVYGYFWYREVLEYKDLKMEVLFASGNGGQYMMVVPEYDLAIAFTGSNYGSWRGKMPFGVLLKYIIPMLMEV